ncbi:MAG: helix-turn-helix transcriptional regulator [Calditrichaeota bacterium]|nr:helix-turn-helix transcriptional regulator [Calditrichota bacterium]
MVGSKIRIWREEKEMSLGTLANLLDMDRSTLHRWEKTEKDYPSVDDKLLYLDTWHLLGAAMIQDLGLSVVWLALSRRASSKKGQHPKFSFFEEECLKIHIPGNDLEDFYQKNTLSNLPRSSEQAFRRLTATKREEEKGPEIVLATVANGVFDEEDLKRNHLTKIGYIPLPFNFIQAISKRELNIANARDYARLSIGFMRGSYTETLIRKWLRPRFFPPDGGGELIAFPEFEASAIQRYLDSGMIDVFIVGQPYATELQHTLGSFYEWPFVSLAGQKGLAQNPTPAGGIDLRNRYWILAKNLDELMIKRLLRALIKANRFFKEERSEAIRIITETIGLTPGRFEKHLLDEMNFEFRIAREVVYNQVLVNTGTPSRDLSLSYVADIALSMIGFGLSAASSGKSLFEENGLSMKAEPYLRSESAFESMLQGKFDACIVSPKLYHSREKEGLRQVATITAPSHFLQVLRPRRDRESAPELWRYYQAVAKRKLDQFGGGNFTIGFLQGSFSQFIVSQKLLPRLTFDRDQFAPHLKPIPAVEDPRDSRDLSARLDLTVEEILKQLNSPEPHRMDIFVGMDPLMSRLYSALDPQGENYYLEPLYHTLELGANRVEYAVLMTEEAVADREKCCRFLRSIHKTFALAGDDPELVYNYIQGGQGNHPLSMDRDTWCRFRFELKLDYDLLLKDILTLTAP